MPFARLASTVRLAAAASLFATLTLGCWAQEAPGAPMPQASSAKPLPVLNYAKPVSHFPNPIGPYTPRHLSAPNLSNTGRIDQLMHDGKLSLSLADAIALALENNLDIAIARYNLNIADTDVLRSKAGAAILGVAAEAGKEKGEREVAAGNSGGLCCVRCLIRARGIAARSSAAGAGAGAG